MKTALIDERDDMALDVYRGGMRALQASGIPFLVGGAFALEIYCGVTRRTKDMDLFVRPEHAEPVLSSLSKSGYTTEMRFPHWLGKAFKDEHCIDVIFGSGNGISTVDGEWFAYAPTADVLDLAVRLVPPEEMIWSKAFIMERARFDGGDIAHLLRGRGKSLDWSRLLRRFNGHWRILLSHLILFGFIYPGHRLLIPRWLMEELMRRVHREMTCLPSDERLCQGTLLSWSEYLMDTDEGNYRDARLSPYGALSLSETTHITNTLSHERHNNGDTDKKADPERGT